MSTDDHAAARRALLERMLAERGIQATAHEPEVLVDASDVLSPAQERIWFHHQMDPNSIVHNLTAAVWIGDDVDEQALRKAVDLLVDEHPILRTVYEDLDGRASQRADTALEIPLAVHEPHSESHALEQARSLARVPFDLCDQAPIRFHLLRGDDRDLLVTVVHHIAADDASWGVLLPTLLSRYADLSHGRDLRGFEVKDHAAAVALRRSRLHRHRTESDLAHWRSRLTPPPSPVRFSTDRPRTAEVDESGADITHTLDRTGLDPLIALGRECGATPFMSLLAAFAALVHRVSGDQDLTIGTPVSLREDDAVAAMVGNFQNTVALRIALENTTTFRALLGIVRDEARDAFAHHELPFDEVVAQLRPPRTAGRSPYFDAMFLEQRSTIGDAEIPGLHLTEQPVHNGTSQFDITLAVNHGADVPRVTALYKTALYERATVEQLLSLYARIIGAAAAQPDVPLGALRLIDQTAEAAAWSDAVPSVAADAPSLPDRFVEVALNSGTKTAVQDADNALSYAELERRSGALARRLRAAGVQDGSPVAVCLAGGLDVVTAILAVSRAGGAYVPVDPTYPDERIRWILTDCGATIAITDDTAHPAIHEHAITTLQVDGGQAADDSLPPIHPYDAAYIIYTSGSTGRPKGVKVTHRNALRLFDVTARRFPLNSTDVWSMCHSASFDFSVWEMWGALSTGARLVAIDRMVVRSGEDLRDAFAKHGVTIASLTPTAFHAYATATDTHGHATVRRLILGGEELPLSRLSTWFARDAPPRPDLVLMYGITETTVHVTGTIVRAEDLARVDGSILGEPLEDMSVLLVDSEGVPVPDGVAGEILVAGGGVSAGYLNDTDRTAEKFRSGDGAATAITFYRSGDLGRRRTDGTIEYLGRNDVQLEVRGHRIEPAEIEAVLAAHPGVAQIGVTADKERLTAHIVRRHGHSLDAAVLRQHAGRSLPDHLVPTRYVAHDDLPRTPSGKLDRRALPTHAGTAMHAAQPRDPRGATEFALIAIWREELDIEEGSAISVEDNYFDIGGHSLLLAGIRARIATELGHDLPIAWLYAYPTIRQLAEHLSTPNRLPESRIGVDPTERARARRSRAARGAQRANGVPRGAR
ncbi:MAG: non-ribosomal peptide synthetase [Cumulibacter sp.]